MLETLLGNRTIEKTLLYIFTYSEGYATKISQLFSIPLNGVQQQLQRLENGGVLVSQMKGKTRLYMFNPRYVFLDELKGILKKAMQVLSSSELKLYFRERTRPRRKGKPQ